MMSGLASGADTPGAGVRTVRLGRSIGRILAPPSGPVFEVATPTPLGILALTVIKPSL
jgi:hypothetical protein